MTTRPLCSLKKKSSFSSFRLVTGLLNLLHSEWPKLNRVLAILSVIGLNNHVKSRITAVSDYGLYVYICTFSTILTKGNNFCDFLFASLDDKTYLQMVESEKKNFALRGASSFL